MRYPGPAQRSKLLPYLRAVVIPLLTMGLLWFTSGNSVTLGQTVLCSALLFIPWLSYLRWHQRKNYDLPVFAMLSFMYWLYYALALFWGDLTTGIARALGREAEPEELTLALLMSLLGIICLWLGMNARIGKQFIPRRLPEISSYRSRRNYLRGVLLISSFFSLLEPSAFLFGSGGRQIIILSITFIPLLAFTILLRLYLRGEASQVDKLLLVGFLLTRMIVGLSSGWLGSAASIIMICGATFLAERKRIPRSLVFAGILLTLFFQVGKEEFRRVYWTDKTEASQIDRVSFWFNTSLGKWSDALADPSGASIRGLLNQSVTRVSLLTQSANVLAQTPEIVPYQNGELYKYMFVTFIPRAVWPDKPSVSDANQFYQIAYGVTAEEDINKVAIGVGVLTEAFINFGWAGVIGIMFLIGIILDFYQNSFLGKSSGTLMSSLGIALLPQILTVEAQMAAYLGGIIQQVFFSLIVLLPIIRWKRTNKTRKVPRLGGVTEALQRV